MVNRKTGTMSVAEAERLFAGPMTSLAPLTLAAGDDDFLRDRVVAAFRAGAEKEGSELLRLEGDSTGGEAMAEALGSISLFATARRIWIREAAKLAKGAEEVLLAWVGSGGDGARVLVTTARAVADLKTLQNLAAVGSTVTCEGAQAESRRWAERLLEEAGLKLPSQAVEMLLARAPSLLALSHEIEKLAVHAETGGKLPASALDALAAARGGGSTERWADAVLAGDLERARKEAAILDAEGVGGTGSLWAIAERALAALDPPPYAAWQRSGSRASGLSAAAARRALDAVYRADRALKRGEIPDAELRDFVEQTIAGGTIG